MQLNDFSRQKTFFTPTCSRTQMQVLNVVARQTLLGILPFIIYSMSFLKCHCCCVLFVCSCMCACFCFTSFEWTFLGVFFGLTRRWRKWLKWRRPLLCTYLAMEQHVLHYHSCAVEVIRSSLLNSRCYRVHMQQCFHNRAFVYK